MIKKWIPYIIITILLLPIVAPLYASTILGSADNLAHLFRVVNLETALREGYVWPRWAGLEGHGYGAPIFNFNYVLPYYIVVLLWKLCGSLIYGSELYMMLALVGSAYGMYAFAASLFAVPAAIVAAVAYAYIPYHLMTIYLYGGYGEALAFVWIPLLALGFVRMVQSPSQMLYRVWSCILLSLLILSHNLSALMALPFVYSIFFVNSKNAKEMLKNLSNAMFVTTMSALLTAWFWLPAVVEQHYTKLSILFEKETSLRGHFFELISPIVSNSFAALGFVAPSYYSYAIGLPTLLVVVVSAGLVLHHMRTRVHKGTDLITRIGILYLAWWILTLYMTRQSSEYVWQLLPARLNFLSYPYRFFFLNTFSAAMLAGYCVHVLAPHMRKSTHKVFICLTIGFFIWQGYIYAHPNVDRFAFKEQYFGYIQTVREAPFTHKNMGYIEFIPRTADSAFVNSLDTVQSPIPRAQIVDGEGSIRILENKTQEYVLQVNTSKQAKVQVNTLYFPGWIGMVGDVQYKPAIDVYGRMLFTVPGGTQELRVLFTDTPIRTLAKWISLLSIFGLILYLFFCGKATKRLSQHREPARS